MLQRAAKAIRRERGSMLVLVALAMVSLLGMGSLVLDIGQLVAVKQHLSNVADAAVLAGVRSLPVDTFRAEEDAYAYVEMNGVARQDAAVSIIDRNRIGVSLKGNAPFSLAWVFGWLNRDVQADSEAVIGPITAMRGVVPLGVVKQDFRYGELYTLKVGAHSDDPGSYGGNFHALALGGQGANIYLDNLKYGYTGSMEIGEIVDTEPGNMVGKTREGLNYRLGLDPDSEYDNFPAGSARMLFVPMVETFEVEGRSEVRVVGFSAFFMEDTGGAGEITGRFLRYVAEGEINESGDITGGGLLGVKLVR